MEPFFAGCAVAAGCWTLRAGLLAAKHVKAPPMPNMPNLGAAAPNWGAAAAAAQKLYQDAASRVVGGHPGGFEKAMTRREAAMILGVKCAHAPLHRDAPTPQTRGPAFAALRARGYAHAPLPPGPRGPRPRPTRNTTSQGERAKERAQGGAPQNHAAQPP